MILRFNFYKRKFPWGVVLLICLVLSAGGALVSSPGLLKNFVRETTLWSQRIRSSKRDFSLAREKQKKEKLVLCGVMQVGDQRYAFIKTPDNKQYMLKEGSFAGDFRVDLITTDSVLITRSDYTKETLRW